MIRVDALSLLLILSVIIPSWFFTDTVKLSCAIGAWLIPAVSVIYKCLRFSGLNFNFTPRAIRLMSFFLLTAALFCLPVLFVENLIYLSPVFPCAGFIYLVIASGIVYPYEKRLYVKFINETKKKLSNPQLIKIGITGSFGKTGVKNYLAQILSAKYKVFTPPLNYNTPMGIAKACNSLPDETQVAILEMGARKKGDIKELMDLINPQYGILTGFAPQHLETFISMDNIVEEKCMVLNVPYCAYANDNLDAVKANGTIKKIGDEINVCDISQSQGGISFDFSYKEHAFRLKTSLLGAHNSTNIALACACAIDLGIDDISIIKQVEELKPIPHRQELIINAKGVKIIDDSYNINLCGAVSALQTLSSFSGRKWVTVFGIVEGGERESEINQMLGNEIGRKSDFAIIVGDKYREPILRGIKEIGNIKVYCVKDLEACKQIYVSELRGGDNLLLLANLPKQYLL